jgi:hypothetical protein
MQPNGYRDQDDYAPRGLGPNRRGPDDDFAGPRGLGPGQRTAPQQSEPPQVEKTEQYSLQVLRRLHADANILMEEYHDMMGPLEHDGIAQHIQGKLEKLVSEIEQLEALARQHHPGAVLDGKMR